MRTEAKKQTQITYGLTEKGKEAKARANSTYGHSLKGRAAHCKYRHSLRGRIVRQIYILRRDTWCPKCHSNLMLPNLDNDIECTMCGCIRYS